MSDTLLNLPKWEYSSNSSVRVGSAVARANKTAMDIVKSIPDTDADYLKSAMDNMLAPGTIKSLEEMYELTGVANPSPTKYEKEAALNNSGYTVVDSSVFFKIDNSDNIEAIRMLYNAGMSIDDIRRKLVKLNEGDVIVLKCGKKILRFPKSDYYKLLESHPNLRAYKEYITNVDSYSYAVTDSIGGDLAVFILYVEQDSNEKPFLSCKAAEFPVVGNLKINVNDTQYSFDIAADSSDALIPQLNSVVSPLSFSYNNGLDITCDYEFSFVKSDTAKRLGIEDALRELRQSMHSGYTGGKIIDNGEKEPYSICVCKPMYSSSNSRKIYNEMAAAGVSKDICDSYLRGSSLYSSVQSNNDALINIIKTNPDNNELIEQYTNQLYSSANVRIVGTTKQTIKRVLKLDDTKLEYLLRYREDITGINPYVENDEARDSIIQSTINSKGGTYFAKVGSDSDEWKQNTANVRTVSVQEQLIVNEDDEQERKNLLDYCSDFLDSVVYEYYKERYSKQATYYSDSTLGLNVATTFNWGATYSFAKGLESFANIKSEIPTDYLKDFEEDMLVIQGYLDAAFAAFYDICKKLGNIINIINSSLNITANTGLGLSLGAGSLMQCSLDLDLGLNIPIYIPKINEILLKLIEKLEDIVKAIIDIEKKLLCPIQNLLDKYINTKDFVLPCKIYYKVPVIADLGSYLQNYLNALANLKLMCRVSKRDTNWLKYKASMMPGSLQLLVTNSADCKES